MGHCSRSSASLRDTWKTADELATAQPAAHAQWQRLPFDAIERVANMCRKGVTCKANRQKYAAGHHNIAVELVFEDGTVWIARLTTNPDPLYNLDASTIADFMKIEVATLRIVSERTTIPVATVFAYSATRDNPIGWPYVLMSALEGYRPQDVGLCPTPSNQPVPVERLPLVDTFCAALAEAVVQLGWIKFATTGSICLDGDGEYAVRADVECCATSAEYWCMYLACAHFKADLKSHPDREFGLWLLKMAVLKHRDTAHDGGPFGLAHRNLDLDNILVDKSGALTGVFGWSTAACLPRDFCAMQGVPLFAAPAVPARRDSDPWRETLAAAFSSALAEVAPRLAARYSSADIRILSRATACPPAGWAAPAFWHAMCMSLWKRPNWERVREERAVLEWLSGGEKPGTKREGMPSFADVVFEDFREE